MSWIYGCKFEEPIEDWNDKKFWVNWYITPSEALCNKADKIRKDKGYTDLLNDINNEVYYDFYLQYSLDKQGYKKIEVYFVCAHGEKDDYANYFIPLNNYEKEKLKEIAEKLIKKDMVGEVKALDMAIDILKGE